MERKVLKVALVCVLAMSVASYAGTVAHWDFEDGVDGQSFDPDGGGDSGSTSIEGNNYLMRGWDATHGPSFTSDTLAGNLASRNNRQDGYVTSEATGLWGASFSTWTIEATFKMYGGDWNKTLIGIDGSADAGLASTLYFGTRGTDRFIIDFMSTGGERYAIEYNAGTVEMETWYSLAATSDGTTLSLYLNDIASGAGYQLVSTLDMTTGGDLDTSLAATSANWTFGRGWYKSGFVDYADAVIDEVRISDAALGVEELITVVPEPATMALLGVGALAMLRKRR